MCAEKKARKGVKVGEKARLTATLLLLLLKPSRSTLQEAEVEVQKQRGLRLASLEMQYRVAGQVGAAYTLASKPLLQVHHFISLSRA